MKAVRYLHKAPFRVIRINRRSSRIKFRRTMLRLKLALLQEKAETKEMLAIYRRHASGQATKEELAVANEQFLDVLKGIGLGIFAVLPFAPITIPILVKLARMVGVDIIPSAFITKETKGRRKKDEKPE